MSENLPSEDAICRCQALYLGTSLFNTSNKKFNESSLSLSQLQDSISDRYPIDGSNFARGIQTGLTIYPSGIQMEHSSAKDLSSISALFHYPIKSLVYCGALRFINSLDQSDRESRPWKFVPLDTELAQKNENFKNPPLFVVFLKAIDPNTKKQIVECLVFVVGMVKTAMKLIESCQKAFNLTRETVNEFYRKFGNIPVVYCLKNDLNTNDKRILVKKFDEKGYFYATENTPIDLWQLFEENENLYETMSKSKIKAYQQRKEIVENLYSEVRLKNKDSNKIEKKDDFKTDVMEIKNPKVSNKCDETFIDPYEKSDNLIKVEKRVDPMTGQNIYVRYLAEPCSKSATKTYDLPNQVYESESEALCESDEDVKKPPPIIIRQEKTPSPIIVEKYIKKKAPQVIIKEIHVHEPAPPPVKIIQMDNQYDNETLRAPIENCHQLRTRPPPNILGPKAIEYPGQYTLPRQVNGATIRIVNSNNNTNHLTPNGNCVPPPYTDIKSLLNKAYGYPGFDYNVEKQMCRERYPVYSSLNRNYTFNCRPKPEIEYRKFAGNDIYDYNLKPRRLFNDVKKQTVNYSSLKPNQVKRYSSSQPKYDDFKKNYHTKPSDNRKVYADHSRSHATDKTSYRSRPLENIDIHQPKPNHRNPSSGRVESRKPYNY
ncbi:unnamed protein product [Brachionus calyciflorus]|uniref:Uncharacterized protein n=1 Tax=Brachionus calyciflorus TaxID=104777 RepID=A0A813V1S9_9BILA|nr:unnamed protein product [Brachionus calyciflorus]